MRPHLSVRRGYTGLRTGHWFGKHTCHTTPHHMQVAGTVASTATTMVRRRRRHTCLCGEDARASGLAIVLETYMPHHTVSHAGGGGGGVDGHDDGAPPPPPPAPPGWTCLSTQGPQAWSVHINSGDPRGIRRGSEGIRSPNRGSGLCRPYVLWGIRRPQSSII